MLLASKQTRRRGGEALRRVTVERATSFARLATSLTTSITLTDRVRLFSCTRACFSSSCSCAPSFSLSSTTKRKEEKGQRERSKTEAGLESGDGRTLLSSFAVFEAGSRARDLRSRRFSTSFASSSSFWREKQGEKELRDRWTAGEGLAVAPLLLPLPLTPPQPPTMTPSARLHFFHAAGSRAGRRHCGGSSSSERRGRGQRRDAKQQQASPSSKPATTATSIADALRLPPNSLAKLDLSGGSADLRCVNLLCERVGKSCVCRLSLVLSRVAERHWESLLELSLARNGIEELPAAVFEFFEGRGESGEGESENRSSSTAPSFQALCRIDLSGNEGLQEVRGVGRGAAMPGLREIVVDRGVRVFVSEGGKGGVEVVEV